jgi:DNA polymerase I-like protein with 3'-5' exonuclease and polymerase domains
VHYLTLDFELYWGVGYSLRSTPIHEFVTDERFEILTAFWSIHDDSGKLIKESYAVGSDMSLLASDIKNIKPLSLIAANSQLEAFILNHALSISTDKHIHTIHDVLQMSRYALGYQFSHSLGNLSKLLPIKKGNEAEVAKEKRLSDFSDYALKRMLAYNRRDIRNTWQLFQLLKKANTQRSFNVQDQLTRWSVEPKVMLDVDMLHITAEELRSKRHADYDKLESMGIDHKQVTSNPQFASLLTSLGVEPPTKISETTGKVTWAFSKQDLGYKDLFLHEDPQIRELMQIRKRLKSTILESRVKRFLTVAERLDNKMIFPLRYMSAATGRNGGGSRLNIQNLQRGSILRKAITATPGYVIGTTDYSSLEVRIMAAVSDHKDHLQAFTLFDRGEGPDFYKAEAARNLNVSVETITKDQRFMSKVKTLALQYKQRYRGYRHLLALGPFGNDPIYISEQEALNDINNYEKANPSIVKFWDLCDIIINNYLLPNRSTELGIFSIKGQQITLPSGHFWSFRGLTRFNNDDYDIRYPRRLDTNQGYRKIYAGLLANNLIQGIGADMINYPIGNLPQKLEKYGAYLISMTHDEILWTAPEHHADKVRVIVEEEMKTPLPYIPSMPVNVESAVGERYEK